MFTVVIGFLKEKCSVHIIPIQHLKSTIFVLYLFILTTHIPPKPEPAHICWLTLNGIPQIWALKISTSIALRTDETPPNR